MAPDVSDLPQEARILLAALRLVFISVLYSGYGRRFDDGLVCSLSFENPVWMMTLPLWKSDCLEPIDLVVLRPETSSFLGEAFGTFAAVGVPLMKAFGARESRGELCSLKTGVVNMSIFLDGAFDVSGCFLPLCLVAPMS